MFPPQRSCSRLAVRKSSSDARTRERSNKLSMSHEAAREACLVTASRVARQLGFEYAEDSALEALADVVRYYVNGVARRSAANARHAQRSDLALNDVLAGLRQTPASPVTWAELRDFAFRGDGGGWTAPDGGPGGASCLPAAKRRRAAHYGALGAADAPRPPRSVHIPKFLPPFPPKVAAAARRKRDRGDGGGGDDRSPAEVEALQLALNRIGGARARDGAAAPGSSYGAPIDLA